MYYFLPNSLGNAAPLAAAGHLRSLAPPPRFLGAPRRPAHAPAARPRGSVRPAGRRTKPHAPRPLHCRGPSHLPSRRPAAWSEPAGAEERKCRPRGTEPAVPRCLPRSTQDARGRGHGTPRRGRAEPAPLRPGPGGRAPWWPAVVPGAPGPGRLPGPGAARPESPELARPSTRVDRDAVPAGSAGGPRLRGPRGRIHVLNCYTITVLRLKQYNIILQRSFFF